MPVAPSSGYQAGARGWQWIKLKRALKAYQPTGWTRSRLERKALRELHRAGLHPTGVNVWVPAAAVEYYPVNVLPLEEMEDAVVVHFQRLARVVRADHDRVRAVRAVNRQHAVLERDPLADKRMTRDLAARANESAALNLDKGADARFRADGDRPVLVGAPSGERVVQGYVDSTNASRSWVTASSALGFYAIAEHANGTITHAAQVRRVQMEEASPGGTHAVTGPQKGRMRVE